MHLVMNLYGLFLAGVSPGIDNAAHVGGLLAAALPGVLVYVERRVRVSGSRRTE